MKFETTLKQLREHGACGSKTTPYTGRYKYLIDHLPENFGEEEPLALVKILEINGVADCLWAVRCFGNDSNLKIIAVKFAVCCAKKALKYFEKKYPNDKRPQLAIEAAEKYIKNPSAHSAAFTAAFTAAADTAVAAYAAADAADGADAAFTATQSAAADAVFAAYAAASAADAAYADAVFAAYAAASAASASMEKEHAVELKRLLTENRA